MKFVAISDTHTLHHHLVLPSADVIIHAGDITSSGSKKEVISFLEWFSQLDYPHKVMIAGNHDFFFDYHWNAYTSLGKQRHYNKVVDFSDIQELLVKYPSITYLEDSGTTINGIKIWGSPITPWFHDWAFNRERGLDIKKHWDLIPLDTDILVTHGPPFGISDLVYRDQESVGCEELAKVLAQIHPKVHIFGHIHEGYGVWDSLDYPTTQFINASSVNIYYETTNDPIVFNVKPNGK